MKNKVKKVAQIWFVDSFGNHGPINNKYYSKIGTAENIAKKYNQTSASEYYVVVYNLEFVGDIRFNQKAVL